MRELVIVIQDLYLPAQGSGLPLPAEPLAGLEFIVRFGARAPLTHGWRPWLAEWLGRGDLAAVAPARLAAAVHPRLAHHPQTLWLASPVHLSAGLSRVHLAPAGLLFLHEDELARLAQDFAAAFTGSGFVLTPASPRELLLLTPGIEPVATAEPARFAGAEVNEALPRGPAAAGLRRTWTEMEMWLHAWPPNHARRVAVTALWPWGALGSGTLPAAATAATAATAASGPVAFAHDACVRGLWHICGLACQAVPQGLEEILGGDTAGRAVLVTEAGSLLSEESAHLGAGLARLDARYLSPAVQALRAGRIGRLRLLANDLGFGVTRGDALKFWRRPRPGLRGLA